MTSPYVLAGMVDYAKDEAFKLAKKVIIVGYQINYKSKELAVGIDKTQAALVNHTKDRSYITLK